MDLSRLENLISFYEKLPDAVMLSADTSMTVNSAELIEYNKDQLKNSGEDSEGAKLQFKYPRKTKTVGAYTAAYGRFKHNKYGGQTEFVDLSLTGETLDSLRLDHKSLGLFSIYSETNNDLLNVLMKNYTDDIIGVQENNLQEFALKNMQPEIENDIEILIQKL